MRVFSSIAACICCPHWPTRWSFPRSKQVILCFCKDCFGSEVCFDFDHNVMHAPSGSLCSQVCMCMQATMHLFVFFCHKCWPLSERSSMTTSVFVILSFFFCFLSFSFFCVQSDQRLSTRRDFFGHCQRCIQPQCSVCASR